MAAADETNWCCGVPKMKDMQEKQLLVIGGLLNILLPLGTGALVCGIATKNKQLTKVGILQLASAFVVVGTFWSLIYGFLMVIQGMQPSETTPASAPVAVEEAQRPPTPPETPSQVAAPAQPVAAQPSMDTSVVAGVKADGASDEPLDLEAGQRLSAL